MQSKKLSGIKLYIKLTLINRCTKRSLKKAASVIFLLCKKNKIIYYLKLLIGRL
jgi:hypothetical protein